MESVGNGKSAYSGRKAGRAGTRSPRICILPPRCFRPPFFAGERRGGSRRLGTPPFGGDPALPPARLATDPAERAERSALRPTPAALGSLGSARGGEAGILARESPRSCRQAPCALGSLSAAASPRLPGVRAAPPPPPRLPPLPLPPAPPAGARTPGLRTWARGRRRPLLPLPEPEPEPARSLSMLRALRPPSAQLLAPAQPGEQAQRRRGGGQGLAEGRGGPGRAGL